MTAKRFGTSAETALRAFLRARGYLCIRSAASKCLDLVCASPSLVYGLEVKATHGNVHYVSRNAVSKVQHDELVDIEITYPCVKTQYVVRFMDGFEVFPPFETVMRRGKGIPIEEFFPVLLHSPNKPPIVPHGSDAQVVAVVPRAEVKGSWHLEPGGDAQ